jgi:hypothetical protein
MSLATAGKQLVPRLTAFTDSRWRLFIPWQLNIHQARICWWLQHVVWSRVRFQQGSFNVAGAASEFQNPALSIVLSLLALLLEVAQPRPLQVAVPRV